MFSVVKPLIFKDERLAILSGQVDQLLIRELCAAFRIIDGLHTTESEGMKARHLDQAERQLLNGIALDPTLTTAGKGNNYWVARAYFGLSLVASLRREERDSIRLLLIACTNDPREARETFAAEFFKEVFLPQCQEIEAEYQQHVVRLPSYADQSWELKKKIAWLYTKSVGGKVLGALPALFGAPPSSIATGVRATAQLDRDIKMAEAELAAIPTEYSIGTKRDAQFDERLKILAQQSLDAMTGKPPSLPASPSGA